MSEPQSALLLRKQLAGKWFSSEDWVGNHVLADNGQNAKRVRETTSLKAIAFSITHYIYVVHASKNNFIHVPRASIAYILHFPAVCTFLQHCKLWRKIDYIIFLYPCSFYFFITTSDIHTSFMLNPLRISNATLILS